MNIRMSNVFAAFALVSAILLGFPVLALSDEGLSSSNQMLTFNGDVTSPVQISAGTIGNCPALLVSPLVVPITGQLGDIMIDDACEHVYVTNQSNNSVEVFSLTTGILDKPIAVGSKPFGLDTSPDGNTLYVANSGDSSISIVDLKQGIESDKIVVPDTYGNQDTPYSLAVASNGLVLFSTTCTGNNWGGRMMQLDSATKELTVRRDFWFFGTTTRDTYLKASGDRNIIGIVSNNYCCNGSTGTVFKYNVTSNTFTYERYLSIYPYFLLPDIAIDFTGAVAVVNTGTSSIVLNSDINPIGTIPSDSNTPIFGEATHPSGKIGFRVVNSGLEILDLVRFTKTGLLDLGDTVGSSNLSQTKDTRRAAISRNGQLLAVITDHGFSIVDTTPSYMLAVKSAGDGSGIVTGTPQGITCGTVCIQSYAMGTTITLTAMANPNSVFTGWSGGGCSGRGNCQVTLSAATTVTASFSLSMLPLTITNQGGGSVSSYPAGIDCGSVCSSSFAFESVVTLTAAPAPGYVFVGWGDACSGVGTCQVTINQATHVIANFILDQTSQSNIECLFGWAEQNYPGLFAPAAATTAVSTVYTYRHYSATNAYLGVSTADNHVYYLGPDGNLQDEGPLSYWLPKADCQNAHWSSIGPTGGVINKLVIDPSNPSILYAVGVQGGVFKTTDGGKSWNSITVGLKISTIYAFAITPSNSAILYAGGDSGISKSINGGMSWSAVNIGLPVGSYITSLAVNPSNPAIVYASIMHPTNAGGSRSTLYKSVNSGANWSEANSGLPSGGVIQSLTIDQFNPATLYAVSYGNDYSSGVYKSSDGGTYWWRINYDMPTGIPVNSIVIAPSNPSILYASTDNFGLYKSANGGLNWLSVSGNLPPSASVKLVTVDPTTPDLLYAMAYWGYNGIITNGGLFKSTNGGVSWAMLGNGLNHNAILSLAINPSNPATLYAGTFDPAKGAGGVYKSIDAGESWNAANSGLAAMTVVALAINPSHSAMLYAGVYGYGIFKSSDGGASWNQANTGLTDASVITLVIDQSNPARLYAGTLSGGGVFKSVDGGTSWSQTHRGDTNPAIASLAIAPSNPSILYAGTYGDGVFKSNDSGENWSQAGTGMINLAIYAIAVDPLNPSTLYVGSDRGGVFKSTDGGKTWTTVNKGLTVLSIDALAIDSSNPSTIYAATPGAGVFKSGNGGEGWSPSSTGLPQNAYVRTLTIDPSSPTTLYAGTFGFGLFKSTDSGGSWSLAHPSLPLAAHIMSFAIDPSDPGTVYAGIFGGGVFRSLSPTTECLFNWAEMNYPALNSWMSPATAFWGIYTYRYYSATKTYLGVSSVDNHVYYMGQDGNLLDEGPASYWLPLAGCQ